MTKKVQHSNKNSVNSKSKKPASQTNWERVKRMRAGLEPIDTSDIPELDEEFWKNATYGYFQDRKKAISVRFDADIIKWFKKQGGRYQTRMNNVLRAYMMQCQQQKNS